MVKAMPNKLFMEVGSKKDIKGTTYRIPFKYSDQLVKCNY